MVSVVQKQVDVNLYGKRRTVCVGHNWNKEMYLGTFEKFFRKGYILKKKKKFLQ